MLIRYPRILEMKSIDVDRKLGEIKDLLQLKSNFIINLFITDNDLRKLVVTKPKLIVHPLAEIKVGPIRCISGIFRIYMLLLQK